MWRAIRPRSISSVLAFLGKPFAPDDEPGLGLRQILTAQIANGDCVPLLGSLLGWIDASFDIAEKAPRLAAGLIRGQSSVVTDRKASRSALTIAELDHE